MSTVLERVEHQTTSVDVILRGLLAYEEIIGAVAVNPEGLVMGSAGMIETDIDVVSLLGASLAGVAERTTRRLGAGDAIGLSLITSEGMITIRNGETLAVVVFSGPCDSRTLLEALVEPMAEIADIIAPG